jgi:hypothetical protein
MSIRASPWWRRWHLGKLPRGNSGRRSDSIEAYEGTSSGGRVKRGGYSHEYQGYPEEPRQARSASKHQRPLGGRQLAVTCELPERSLAVGGVSRPAVAGTNPSAASYTTHDLHFFVGGSSASRSRVVRVRMMSRTALTLSQSVSTRRRSTTPKSAFTPTRSVRAHSSDKTAGRKFKAELGFRTIKVLSSSEKK